MARTVYAQVMIRTISWKSDGEPLPLRLELAHQPVPIPTTQPRGLLGWLFGRPKLEYQPAPLQIPWSPDANFAGDYSALPNNNRRAVLAPVAGEKK